MNFKAHSLGCMVLAAMLSSSAKAQQPVTQDPQEAQEKASRVPEVNLEVSGVSGVDADVHADVQDPQNKQRDPLQQQKKKQPKTYSQWGFQRQDAPTPATRFGFTQLKRAAEEQPVAEDVKKVPKALPSRQLTAWTEQSSSDTNPSARNSGLANNNAEPESTKTFGQPVGSLNANSTSSFDFAHSGSTMPSTPYSTSQLAYKRTVPPTLAASELREEHTRGFEQSAVRNDRTPVFTNPFAKTNTFASSEKVKREPKKKQLSPSTKKRSANRSQLQSRHSQVPNAIFPSTKR